MNAPDLSPSIKGLLVVIGIAITTGQFPKLEAWSREQAAEALSWKQGLPHFFKVPPQHHRSKHKA